MTKEFPGKKYNPVIRGNEYTKALVKNLTFGLL